MVGDTGLQIMYSPEEAGRGSPVADVVFVHGLGGHRRKTWTQKKVPNPSNTPSLLGRLLPSRKRKAIALDDESNIQTSDQAERGGVDVFWPKDLLPKDLPNCRICTWGYNVDLNLVRRDTSTATVFQHAKNLLSDVADARMSNTEKTRPLIFVAHSLGGIVVKDALNISYKERSYLGEIFLATKGICFLGTPHRGSSKAALAETLSRVTETWGNSPNMQILQALKYDAETLDRVHSDFLMVHSEQPMKIRTFQEGLDYKGLIIVDRFSSRMDIQGEMPVDIEANHVDMAKFSSSKDNGYIRVSKTLLRWVTELEQREIQASSTLNDIMEDCLKSLNNTKRGSRSHEVEKAFRGTLDWLFSDRVSFSSWLQDSQRSGSPIYWISGKPGSGKSTIMKYALNHKTTMRLLQLSSLGNWSTLSFFFHDRGSDIQKSIHGLMEELVYQLLSEHRNLIPLVCHLRLLQLIEISGKPQWSGAPVFDSRTTWNKDELEEAKRILDTVTPEERQSTWPLEQLEKAFEIITTQSTVPLKVCLFIDALDEHSGDHGRLLAVIRRLEQKDATDTVILKICVSSRPEPSFVVAFASCPQFKVHHHTRDDIARYAQGCLKSSSNASTAELDVAQLEKLGAEVTKKADGVFIWVRLVIQELVEEFVNGSSFTQLWQLLSTLPKELKDLYSRILQKRKPEYKDEFYLMCCVMLKTHSPLSLENLLLVIDVNLTGQWSNLSAESMVRRLSSRSGGLIEVVSQRNDDTVRANDGVQFIHKTFKDFIRIPENIPIVDDQATNDTNFVGCKSLLTASVYILKHLNVDRRNNHEEIYQHTFRYAAQMDRHSLRSAMIPILDELLESRGYDVSEPGIVGLLLWMEKFGKSSPSIKMKKSSWQSSPRSLQYDLATIAADYGCLYYVERKVSEGLPTEYLKRCPLLWSVVCGFVQVKFTQRLWEIDHYIYILEFLVDQGAKVGGTWQLENAWWHLRSSDALQLLLLESKTLSSMTSSDDTLQMMNWLLENGANPNRQLETKKDVEGHGLWYLADKGIWNYPLWKLLLKHGADPALKGGHDHRLLYFAILKGKSKIAKLLCRAGADPTKLGQGISALRLEQCALAHFTYNKDDMRSFVENANRMQRMLQKFGNGVASSPAKPAEEVPSLINAGEAILHGTEDVRGTKNLSEDSDEDGDEDWEESSDSSSSSSEDDNDGSDVEWQGRDRF